MSSKELQMNLIIAIPLGKENAVLSSALENEFGVCGQAIRSAVNDLRADGYPVCSYRFGYYWSDKEEDIKSTISMLNHRCYKMIRAAKGMEKILKSSNESNLHNADNDMKEVVL